MVISPYTKSTTYLSPNSQNKFLNYLNHKRIIDTAATPSLVVVDDNETRDCRNRKTRRAAKSSRSTK